MSDRDKNLIHAVMGTLRRLMPGDRSGENARAVRMFKRVLQFRDLISGKLFRKWSKRDRWPATSGSYIVGEKSAMVAICTLTSPELMEPLSKIDGVAIAGELVTVNLGIENIILNTISNPNIRFLLLCGKESPVFHPAQALQCLFHNGIDDQRRIKEAEGHYPVLNNIGIEQIERFRRQVELVDCTGERDELMIHEVIRKLAQKKKPAFSDNMLSIAENPPSPDKQFRKIRPGGRRGTPTYDPNGFFVITLDREAGEIVLQHYLTDNTPAHEMRGRRADAMIRGLVREGLVSQLSHAGYLGIELAKAETALRLGLEYAQDHPVKK